MSNPVHTPDQVDQGLVMMDQVACRVLQLCRDMVDNPVFRDLHGDLQIKVIVLGTLTAIAEIALANANDDEFAKHWLHETLDAAIITAELALAAETKSFEHLREPFKKRGLQ